MKFVLLFIALTLLVLFFGFRRVGVKKPNLSTLEFSLAEAEQIAKQFLESDGNRFQMTLMPEKTKEFDFGYVFRYAPKKFIETGDIMDAVPGNGPLVVNRKDRKAYPLPTAMDSEEAIEDYGRKWRARN